MRPVLPFLNLESNHAQSILDEIVERSGLLLALDGATRYQFTHLTLQEFFAALALKDKSDQLVAKFEADPSTWRETIKLWCGLEHDSTALIKTVAAEHPIIALECLGDAQQVNPDYATELIKSFWVRLGEPHSNEEAALRALALVAADPRPRGKDVFNDLAAILDGRAERKVRLAAARVISLTNLPQATDVLVKRAPRDSAIRKLLAQMGNLAVLASAESVARGKVWALDTLYTIGTPKAALALTPLLWNEDQTTQRQAAWRLGALLADSNVEAALNDFTLSPEQRRAIYMDWVWAPFELDPDSPLRVVGGRITYLLHNAPENTLPPNDLSLTVDSRLAIPLCAVAMKKPAITKRMEVKVLHDLESASLNLRSKQECVACAVADLNYNPVWRYLFHSLELPTQFELLRRLLKRDPRPTQDDWRQIFRPIHYTFDKSFQSRGFKLGMFALVCLGLGLMSAAILQSPQLVTWDNGYILLLGLALAVGGGILRRASMKVADSGKLMAAFAIFVIVPVAGAVMGALGGYVPVASAVGGAFVGAYGGAVLGAFVGQEVFGDEDVGTRVGAVVGMVGVPVGIAVGGAVGAAVGGAIVGAVVGMVIGADFGADFGPFGDVVGGVVGTVGGGAAGVAAVYFPTAWLYERWELVGAGAFWVAWLVWMVGFLMWGAHLERRARAKNPLRGLLEMEGAP